MGGALKCAFTVLSCALTSALLAAAVFAALASWIAPTWSREIRRDAAAAVARLAGVAPPLDSARTGSESQPPSSQPVATSGPGGKSRGGSPIDVGSLEGRLRDLDRSFPAGHGALLPPSTGDGDLRRSLEAWETIRRPLIAFLAAEEAASGGQRARGKLDGGAPIDAIAPALASSLDAIAGARRLLGVKLIGGVEPSTLARLVSSGALSSAEALHVLAARSPAFGAEVIEKVSRIDPRRGASLLEAALREPVQHEPVQREAQATARGDEASGGTRTPSREKDEKNG